jgi:hypothetical protein
MRYLRLLTTHAAGTLRAQSGSTVRFRSDWSTETGPGSKALLGGPFPRSASRARFCTEKTRDICCSPCSLRVLRGSVVRSERTVFRFRAGAQLADQAFSEIGSLAVTALP